MGLPAVGAVGIALLLDSVLAEPPESVHPVAIFGRGIAVTTDAARDSLVGGTLIAVVLPLLVAGIAGGLVAAVARWSPVGATLLAGGWLFSTTSLRMLIDEATSVVRASESDTDRARMAVRALVGRESDDLSPGHLRSAAVESVAENLSDGLVAPLAAFLIGAQVSLSVAVAGAVWVKAVNTLDSMVGYPDRRVGTASARLDDLVMWLPARVTAVLLALVGRSPGALGRARRWAHRPPSPNAGWPMATLAALLTIRLEKPGVYVLNPGDSLPSIDQSLAGLRVGTRSGRLAFVLTGVGVWF